MFLNTGHKKKLGDNCLKCTFEHHAALRWCRRLAVVVLLKILPVCQMKCLFEVANPNYSYVTHPCACWDVDGVQRSAVLKYVSLQENQDRPTYSRSSAQQIISTDVTSSGCWEDGLGDCFMPAAADCNKQNILSPQIQAWITGCSAVHWNSTSNLILRVRHRARWEFTCEEDCCVAVFGP